RLHGQAESTDAADGRPCARAARLLVRTCRKLDRTALLRAAPRPLRGHADETERHLRRHHSVSRSEPAPRTLGTSDPTLLLPCLAGTRAADGLQGTQPGREGVLP